MTGLRFHAPPYPRADDPRLAVAMRQFDQMRRFREIEADRRRLDRWMNDLLGRLLGLITYGRPRRPEFLTFSCGTNPDLTRLVAEVEAVWAEITAEWEQTQAQSAAERAAHLRWLTGDGEPS